MHSPYATTGHCQTFQRFGDGCGHGFDLNHALDCRKGGLVIQRHNEIRDAVGDLANLVWKDVHREPVVREATENSPALIADLAVRGVWQTQSVALLDIRVIDTDAQSYLSRSVQSILSSAETEKRTKYQAACEFRRAAFTPFITSVDGALGKESKAFLHKLTGLLTIKWQKSLDETTNWIRTRLSFAILRATNHCIRGSRIRWRSLGLIDGAPIRLAIS